MCASGAATTAPSSGGESGSKSSGGGGVSRPVAGVIGAVVTLAVLLGLGGLAMLVGGLRIASKKRLAGVASRQGVESKGS